MKALDTKDLREIQEINLMGGYYRIDGVWLKNIEKIASSLRQDPGKALGNELRSKMAKYSPSDTFETPSFIVNTTMFPKEAVTVLLDYCVRYGVYKWIPHYQELFSKLEDTPSPRKEILAKKLATRRSRVPSVGSPPSVTVTSTGRMFAGAINLPSWYTVAETERAMTRRGQDILDAASVSPNNIVVNDDPQTTPEPEDGSTEEEW